MGGKKGRGIKTGKAEEALPKFRTGLVNVQYKMHIHYTHAHEAHTTHTVPVKTNVM